jgi:ABC-type oligopeptide transport system, periplasmic component
MKYLAVLLLVSLFTSGHSLKAHGPVKSLAWSGKPKYPENFTHFDYVNPQAPKGGKVTLGVVGTFDSLNPFIIKGTPAAGLLPLHPYIFYATLLFAPADELFSAYPYIAEKFELAPDRLSMTFYLNPKAKFHDGSPIQADDVLWSFNTLREQGSPLYRQYYADVIKVVKIDALTVRFEFKDASNKELPLILGHFPILSQKEYQHHQFTDAGLRIPLGNGPYRIVNVDAGKSIRYERVKEWWGKDLPIAVGCYNFDEIEYLYFRDRDIAFEAFKAGVFDFRFESSIGNWMQRYDFKAARDGKVIKLEIPFVSAGRMSGLFMNTRRSVFKDPKVREALQYAFDFEWTNATYFYGQYDRITSYFWGLDLAASGPISEAEQEVLAPYRGHILEQVFKAAYEPPQSDGSGDNRAHLRQAATLLEQAGYQVREGVLVDQATGRPFEIEILLNGNTMVRFLNAFVKNLRRLGIKASWRVVDEAQYITRLDKYDFDLIAADLYQSPSPGNEQREFWGSKAAKVPGTRNYAGIEDPVIDALIEKLIDADSREELVVYTRALDRVLLSGHYVIPLWGSTKIRMAYWDKLQHNEAFPKYNFDLLSWWIDPKVLSQ